MNHVALQTILTELPRGIASPWAGHVGRAKAEIEEAMLEAYERGDAGSVRQLRAISSLLDAVR